MSAARLLLTARQHAGLTQRQLAARARIPQASIARIERGRLQPRADTLQRLLEACGASLSTEPRLGVGVDRTAIRERLRLSPAQRGRLGVQEAVTLRRLSRVAPRHEPTRRAADW